MSRAGSGSARQPSRGRRLSGVCALPSPASSRGEDARRRSLSARARDQLRAARQVVIRRGWHRNPVIGGPLRWLGQPPALTSSAARARRYRLGGRGCGRVHAGGHSHVGQTGLWRSSPNTPPASSTAALWSNTRPVNSGARPGTPARTRRGRRNSRDRRCTPRSARSRPAEPVVGGGVAGVERVGELPRPAETRRGAAAPKCSRSQAPSSTARSPARCGRPALLEHLFSLTHAGGCEVRWPRRLRSPAAATTIWSMSRLVIDG